MRGALYQTTCGACGHETAGLYTFTSPRDPTCVRINLRVPEDASWPRQAHAIRQLVPELGDRSLAALRALVQAAPLFELGITSGVHARALESAAGALGLDVVLELLPPDTELRMRYRIPQE
jgi:hypothetical protein